jgi:tetratricopeptide (TPR) repeat protein
MTEVERLKRAIAQVEAQRGVLGEDAVRAALAVLLKEMETLNTAKCGASAVDREAGPRLVGRKAEFGVITRRIERLKEGEGRFVSVIGDAGIGKSRLVGEIRNHVCGLNSDFPAQWLEGSALSLGRVISYLPFRQIVWQYCGITEQDDEDDARRKLRDRLTAVFGNETPEVFPYLATMLSLEVGEEFSYQIEYLNSDAVRRQVFLSARRLFDAIARLSPLVLVFEDLQWIDESSALLLQHLVPLVFRAPLLMIGISRPTLQTPQARLCETLTAVYHSRYDEIRLTPLSDVHSSRLVADLLDDTYQSGVLTTKIVAKAKGNPLFIREIVRSLSDEGLVAKDPSSGIWRLSAEVDDIAIPCTIRGIVVTRVESLEKQLGEIVKTAAVIGRRFLFRVLLAVIQRPSIGLTEQLESLQSLGLIVLDTRSPEPAYLFGHDLIHEAVYEGIHEPERKTLHALVGSAIEAVFSDRLEEFYGFLAYHYSRAEGWEKARRYLLKAGDQAGFIAADAEALVCYTEAERAHSLAFGDKWDPLERASLGRKIGEALFRRAEQERALQYLHSSLNSLGTPVPTSRAGISIRLVQELVVHVWNSLGGSNPRVKEVVTPDVEEAVRTHGALCWIHSSSDIGRFLFHSVMQLNISEREGFGYGMATGLTAFGISCDFLSLFRLAQRYHNLGLQAAERSMHPLAIAYGYMGYALHHSTLADWDKALDFSRKAGELFKGLGDLNSWAYMTHLECSALSYQGNYDQALAISRLTCQVTDNIGDPEAAGRARWNEGNILMRLGRFNEAEQSLNEAEALGRSAKNLISRVIARHDLTLLDLRRGRLEEALVKAQDLERMLLEYRTTQYLCVPSHNAVTETYLRQAEKSHGADKDYWIQRAGLASKRGLKQCKACYLVRPEALRLHGIFKWITGKPKSAKRCWKKALAIAEGAGQRYDAAQILREMGTRLHDRECLEKAEHIHAELSAELPVRD